MRSSIAVLANLTDTVNATLPLLLVSDAADFIGSWQFVAVFLQRVPSET
jgi:hypothetical protein